MTPSFLLRIPWLGNVLWNGITDAVPGDPSLFHAFESMVKRHGGKVAVRYKGRSLTYNEIHRGAEKVAARLSIPAASPPGRVALLFGDRIRALIAILGTLRAGHAFVLLDPDDPLERIRHILHDSDPLAVLTDTANDCHLEDLLPADCRRINVEEPTGKLPSPPPLATTGDSPAYICYTSGSTGTPKGVCQTQRNLLYFVHHYSAALDIRPHDRLSWLYPPGFSAANMDIFGGLLNGATICAYDIRREGIPGLADWLGKEAVSVLHAVPTIFRKLAASLPAGAILSHIRAIDLGGEAVTPQDITLWNAHFPPHSQCWNHLAATEASVIAQCRLERSMAGRASSLPAGKPPQGLEVRIEKEDGSPAGEGETGRIVIASPHITPGYWQQPALNERHFKDDPSRPGWRIFLSDDTGYFGSDGQLYFQGRQGSRIKIRGLSVDLNEVETALRQYPGVREAVVVAVSNAQGEPSLLAAHLVMDPSAPEDSAPIRKHAASRLPGYMVPSAYLFHRAFPQTPSGKVDRLALALLPATGGVDPHIPPANEWEKKVAGAFAEILGRGPVGRNGDFFLLGGDSIAAVDLLGRLSALAGHEIPHIMLLEHTTVAGLALAMEHRAASGGAPAPDALSPLLVPLQTRGNRPVLFLIHGRLGQAHASPRFIQLLGQDQPAYAIQARGLDGRESPHTTLEDMARDYVAAIRTFQEKGPYFLGGLCAGSYIAMIMSSLLRESGEEVLPLLLLDPAPPPFRKPKNPSHKIPDDDGRAYVINQKLELRKHQGRIRTRLDSPALRQAAIDVVMAFEKALSAHTPKPCDHPVFMLSSKHRNTPDKWGSAALRSSCFSGDVKIFEVADKHDDIFDVNQQDFAHHLAFCLESIRNFAPLEVAGNRKVS